MGTPLGPEYIPYTYMDPLGLVRSKVPKIGRYLFLLGVPIIRLTSGGLLR